MSPISLTIAICTKDRPDSLLDVLRTLSSLPMTSLDAVEILVVLDGTNAPSQEDCDLAAGRHVRMRPKGPDERPGLYASRIVCAEEARGDVVLFLDDDAHPCPGYLERLQDLAAAHPTTQGFGGVDRASLPASPSWFAMAYARAFLLAGRSPGKLSPTGFNHSQMSWRQQSEPFESEFLHGCNMAFRKAALRDLPDVPWLSGHACTEDLVISRHATLRGPLLVDPSLGVRHLPGEGGRGSAPQRLRTMLVNHARFQAWRTGSRPMFLEWSMLGLFLRDLALPGRKGLDRRQVVSTYIEALRMRLGE